MVGLEVVVAFLNTVDERSFRHHGQSHFGVEKLSTPRELSTWLADHDLLPAATTLHRLDVAAAVGLRTALRHALVGDVPVGDLGLADFPLALSVDASGHLHIAARSGRPWLDPIVETVACSVARGDWSRIKLCAADDCRWAFYDTSRNGRGRWCDMEVCGNRHKTRAYRERRKQLTGR